MRSTVVRSRFLGAQAALLALCGVALSGAMLKPTALAQVAIDLGTLRDDNLVEGRPAAAGDRVFYSFTAADDACFRFETESDGNLVFWIRVYDSERRQFTAFRVNSGDARPTARGGHVALFAQERFFFSVQLSNESLDPFRVSIRRAPFEAC